MRRSFTGEPVDAVELSSLAAEALRSPTAGNSRGIELGILDGAEAVAAYLDASTDAEWRARSARLEGLRRAGAAVLVLADPSAYVERYAEADKARSGLGAGTGQWPVPYWVGDAGSATMALLLLLEEAGLAACFLGAFRQADEVMEACGCPEGRLLYGCVLVGRADGGDHRSASLDRPGPSRAARVLALEPRPPQP